MQKIFVVLFLFMLLLGYAMSVQTLEISNNTLKFANPILFNQDSIHSSDSTKMVSEAQALYSEMDLDDLVNYKAFEQVITGHEKLTKIKNKDIITLIDFSKPSTEKRLYVLDIKNKKLLFSSYVAHGKNSGENYATSFSNINGSYQSSLGFYETENTYQGKNGYSLVLNGLERGINDLAKQRAIVMHGAAYANPESIKSLGRLGRSQGCPALPLALNPIIINHIKGGTLLFIYADNKTYTEKSSVIS